MGFFNLYIMKIILGTIEQRKETIRNYLIDELKFMEIPFDTDCRMEGWKELLKQLVLLNRIDLFIINKSATSVKIVIDKFTYCINFKTEDYLQVIYRERLINEIIND